MASIPKGPIKPLEMVSAFLPILAHTMGVHRCSAHTWPKLRGLFGGKLPVTEWQLTGSTQCTSGQLQVCGKCKLFCTETEMFLDAFCRFLGSPRQNSETRPGWFMC